MACTTPPPSLSKAALALFGLDPAKHRWISYRPAERGQETRRALVHASLLPGFQTKPEAALGVTMAAYEDGEPCADAAD